MTTARSVRLNGNEPSTSHVLRQSESYSNFSCNKIISCKRFLNKRTRKLITVVGWTSGKKSSTSASLPYLRRSKVRQVKKKTKRSKRSPKFSLIHCASSPRPQPCTRPGTRLRQTVTNTFSRSVTCPKITCKRRVCWSIRRVTIHTKVSITQTCLSYWCQSIHGSNLWRVQRVVQSLWNFTILKRHASCSRWLMFRRRQLIYHRPRLTHHKKRQQVNSNRVKSAVLCICSGVVRTEKIRIVIRRVWRNHAIFKIKRTQITVWLSSLSDAAVLIKVLLARESRNQNKSLFNRARASYLQ